MGLTGKALLDLIVLDHNVRSSEKEDGVKSALNTYRFSRTMPAANLFTFFLDIGGHFNLVKNGYCMEGLFSTFVNIYAYGKL